MVKTLYKSVRQHIENKNDQDASKANNGHKHIIFLTRGLSLSAYTLTLLDLILLPIEERPSVDDSKNT